MNVEMNARLEQSCWSPLDMDGTYTVATNSFVAGGRDGYFTFLDVVRFLQRASANTHTQREREREGENVFLSFF